MGDWKRKGTEAEERVKWEQAVNEREWRMEVGEEREMEAEE